MDRQAASGFSDSESKAYQITYGDYFSGLARILSHRNLSFLIEALQIQLNNNIATDQIERIDIFSQKHGAFYHPARVDVLIDGQKSSFVANTAISDEGNAVLQREFELLKHLGASIAGEQFLPAVYACNSEVTRSADLSMGVFLGQWLDGFHEFHLHQPADKDVPVIRVWDPEHPACILVRKQTDQLYLEAARILTRFYDLETFEQVYPWHHAAGDFIVRVDGDNLALKLITVRNYCALQAAEEKDPVTILQALFLFFIGLSMRLRLDRHEGTGEPLWAGMDAVPPSVDGFLLGLAEMDDTPLLPDTPLRCFAYYASTLGRADYVEMARDLDTVGFGDSAEYAMVARHAEAHLQAVQRVLEERLS